VTELPADIRQIRLPMPDNPLRYINSYLLTADDGYVLVDCGWDLPVVLEALRAALAEAGLALDDVRRLVITHYHPDHYGLAGTLARLGRPRLLMHRLDWEYVRDAFGDTGRLARESSGWLTRNGFDQSAASEEQRTFERAARFSVVAPDEQLEDGDVIDLGRHRLRVVWTPGHTPGHVCLYDAERGFLISGDHVLQPITPNVSLWGPDAGNPLGDFLASLRKVAALDADLVLPAHGEPFLGLRRRVAELLAHHDRREAEMLDALRDHASTGADVASRVPWTRHKRAYAELPRFQQRMALTETLSHLEELRAHRRVERIEEDGRTYYRLPPAATGHGPVAAGR
jgi:glyoxylase-like metal-dependent hydrolase (beta-lactamase superfamily II)